MRKYSTDGLILTMLRKHADDLPVPPPADASACDMWIAITGHHQWKATGAKHKGIPWSMLFDELVTIGGITDWMTCVVHL